MPLELSPRTEAGAGMIALAGELAADLASRAEDHDRTGTYPVDSVDSLLAAGYFAAPVPEELGGQGASSVHDVLVASSRLARGDASVAIGVNMHFAALLNVVRRFDIAVAAGDERRAAAFAESLEDVSLRGVIMAAAISEPAQDLTRPATRATRVDGGWRIDGRKIFCTMSPAATTFYTAVSYENGKGPRYAYAMVPADAPGVTIHDDWDALGMRASGSNSVSFEGVELPEEAIRGGFPVGMPVPYLERNLAAGLFHASAALGIAEDAWEHVRASLTKKGAPEGRARGLAAEAVIDLSAARAMLSRAGAAIDDHHAAHPDSAGPDEDIVALFTEAQAAKAFIAEASARVVDRALALSGGAGYRSASPLSRAYRDVRAASFMHPLGSTRAFDFIGAAALGLTPALH
jgi:L-evernosamine nitrososynthase